MWLPVVSALAGIVVFLPMNFYPAAFVFLIPLFIFFLREEKLWRLVVGALLFRLIFSMGTVYFTLEPILWISSLLIFCGLPLSIFFFKRLIFKFADTECPQIPTSCSCLLLVSLPFLWTFFDLAQAQYSLAPIYIASAGNALGSSPFLGLAALGGFVVLTFFVVLINSLLAILVLIWRRNPQVAWGFRRQVIYVLIAIIVLLFAGWQIASFELRQNAIAYAALPNSINIAAISTNGTLAVDQLAQLTQELAGQQLDLIIFPEDILNQHVGRPTSYMLGNSSTAVFQDLAKELSTNVLASYDTLQGTTSTLKYGSTILFDQQGSIAGIHNKNRLTFAGEYWPFGNWHPSFYDWLKTRNPSIGTYAIFDQKNADTPGEQNLLSLALGENTVSFAAPICLEIHYPTDLAAYRTQGARFIINPSSNRWIGGGLSHFLYLTTNVKKIESVALQLPIISSGVDDFAGIILPNGQSQMLPYQTTGKTYNVFFGTVRY
jgi:apolipoprotein N-acyltransferase